MEVDEVYLGGKEKNKHAKKKIRGGRGSVGKAIVLGALDRNSNTVQATVVQHNDAETLQEFVYAHTDPEAVVYTDEFTGYASLRRKHETVAHSDGEYVRGAVSTNGIESFWALLRRGYTGTYHHMSRKHLQRYVNEFTGRRAVRWLNTAEQMAHLVRRMAGKRLPYQDLIAPAIIN